MFQQGSLARGKFFRQHGEVSDSGVDGRRFPRGMPINGALLRNEGVYVGNADENFDIAVRQSFRNFDLIQIAGSIIVNRRPQ